MSVWGTGVAVITAAFLVLIWSMMLAAGRSDEDDERLWRQEEAEREAERRRER